MSEIRFLGHAAFELTAEGKSILFDPWITGNPRSPLSSPDDIPSADIVFVTHEHFDHGSDDAIVIARRTGGIIVCASGLDSRFRHTGIGRIVSGDIGTTAHIDDIGITFVPAVHKWEVSPPCGFVVRLPGLHVYHAGDTAYFDEMADLADERIDIAILPIGGTYTMDIRDAAKAVYAIRPRMVIPMHYDTFENIQASPEAFRELVQAPTDVKILDPGQILSLI